MNDAALRSHATLPTASSSPLTRGWPAAELALPVVLTLAAVALRAQFAWHAGPLWRDEVNSVNLANVATLRELYANLEFDSFPLLWLLVLRYWTMLFGTGDAAVRVLGFLMSLLLPAALWWTGRQFRVRPGISLVFCGIAPAFVVWAGVANRGYGLGVALLTLTVGFAWRAYLLPRTARWVALLLVVLLAMHTLFYNALLIAAVLGLLTLLCVVRRRWAGCGWLVGIGLFSAGSMSIYAPAIRGASRWNPLVMGPIDFHWLLNTMANTLGEGGWMLPYIFATVVIGTLLLAMVVFVIRGRVGLALSAESADTLLFVCGLLVLSFVIQMTFLLRLNYFTAPWYYVTLILVLSLCADVVLGVVPQPAWLRLQRSAAIFLLGLMCVPSAWIAVTHRQTNLDLMANYLEQYAAQDDMIVIYPWYLGVTFDRYYHGRAPWASLPPVAFHSWHRYDLVKAQFGDQSSVQPMLDQLQSTLAAGKQIWLIGNLPNSGMTFPVQPPAPAADAPKLAWMEGIWDSVWGQQATFVIKSVEVVGARVVLTDEPVNGFENVSLTRIQRKTEASPSQR